MKGRWAFLPRVYNVGMRWAITTGSAPWHGVGLVGSPRSAARAHAWCWLGRLAWERKLHTRPNAPTWVLVRSTPRPLNVLVRSQLFLCTATPPLPSLRFSCPWWDTSQDERLPPVPTHFLYAHGDFFFFGTGSSSSPCCRQHPSRSFRMHISVLWFPD